MGQAGKNSRSVAIGKFCGTCELELPSSEFHKDRTKEDGLRTTCKDCVRKRYDYYMEQSGVKSRRRKKTREYGRWYYREIRYGITKKQYLALEAQQGGRCAICSALDDNLCVDHNHLTGEVRGLLCRTCNSALGYFKDSKLLVERAMRYLNGSSG